MSDPIEERARAEAERVRRLADRTSNTDAAWQQFAVDGAGRSAGRGDRRVRRIVIATLIVAATLVAIVVVTGHDQRRVVPAVPTPNTTDPIETTPTTGDTTSTLPAATTTVLGTTAFGWNPACVGLTASSSTPIATADDPRLDVFGPLGAAPSLRITLPVASIPDDQVVAGGTLVVPVSAQRIPGGYLIAVISSDTVDPTKALPTILAVVNDDGTVRWRQCRTDGFDGTVLVAHGNGAVPTKAVIRVRHLTTDGTPDDDYRIVDLADGRDEGSIHDLAVAAGLDPTYPAALLLASDAHAALFSGRAGDRGNPRVLDANDRIVKIDLDAMSVSVLPLAKPAVGIETNTQWLRLTPAGEPGIIVPRSSTAEPGSALALYHGKRWLTETQAGTALWAASFPIAVDYDLTSGGLMATNAKAAAVWTRSDIGRPGGEGRFLWGTNGVTFGLMCFEGPVHQGCNQPDFGAIEDATGKDLWRLPGSYAVAFVANGMAMVSPAGSTGLGAWSLIDVRTGQPVAADQRWTDRQAFGNNAEGCCAPSIHTDPFGGIVVSVNNSLVSIWLPKDLATPTIEASLS